jgi:hypothetical protein
MSTVLVDKTPAYSEYRCASSRVSNSEDDLSLNGITDRLPFVGT